MPKIQSETIEINLSKLIRNNDDPTQTPIIHNELISTLESVAQELVGEGIIVEINIK